MKKRILSLVLAVVMLVCMMPSAAAAVKTGAIGSEVVSDGGQVIGSFVKSEYDVYCELQNTPTEILLKDGYSEETVKAVKETTVEELLYQRAQLSVNELKNLGYTQEAINVLKEYDGGPLSENPQLKGVFADLTGYFSIISFDGTQMKVCFTWEWSNSPLLDGEFITDMVACGFSGTNESNLPCTMTLKQNDSSCKVYYYLGKNHYDTVSYDISVKDVHQFVQVQFPISVEVMKDERAWAKQGTLLISIKEEKQINQLYSSTFSFGYGHTVLTITPSISVSVGSKFTGGVGLSFGFGTESMFYKTLILKNNGEYEIYNGN